MSNHQDGYDKLAKRLTDRSFPAFLAAISIDNPLDYAYVCGIRFCCQVSLREILPA